MSECNSYQGLCSCGNRGWFQTDPPGDPLLLLGTPRASFSGREMYSGWMVAWAGAVEVATLDEGKQRQKEDWGGRKEGEGSCHRLKAFEEHSGSEPGSGGRPPGSTSCLGHILSQWPCRTGSTAPGFAVFICEVRVIMTPASELRCLRSYPSSTWRSA